MLMASPASALAIINYCILKSYCFVESMIVDPNFSCLYFKKCFKNFKGLIKGIELEMQVIDGTESSRRVVTSNPHTFQLLMKQSSYFNFRLYNLYIEAVIFTKRGHICPYYVTIVIFD